MASTGTARMDASLRAHGVVVTRRTIQRRKEHINLTGDYLWRSSAKIGAGKFRPLRPLQAA